MVQDGRPARAGLSVQLERVDSPPAPSPLGANEWKSGGVSAPVPADLDLMHKKRQPSSVGPSPALVLSSKNDHCQFQTQVP